MTLAVYIPGVYTGTMETSTALITEIESMGFTITGQRDRFFRATHPAFPGWESAWVPKNASGADQMRVLLALYAGVSTDRGQRVKEAHRIDRLRAELARLEKRAAEIRLTLGQAA